MLKRLLASNKNPCFKEPAQWDTLDFDLSGCKFQISLPPQDYEFPEKRQASILNIFDEKMYRYQKEPDENGFPGSMTGFSFEPLLNRSWYTYGPIYRSRYIGTLSCSLSVCDTSKISENFNCFNPEMLERLVLHDAYYSFGPGFSRNESDGPANWKVEVINGVEWIYYEAWERAAEWEPNPSLRDAAHYTVTLCAPMFDNKCVMIGFRSIGSLPPEPSNRLMFERLKQIISSLELTLSPESLKQKLESKQRYPNAKYSPAREPEKWEYYGSYREGNPLDGEPPIVFEGKPSPPPKLF